MAHYVVKNLGLGIMTKDQINEWRIEVAERLTTLESYMEAHKNMAADVKVLADKMNVLSTKTAVFFGGLMLVLTGVGSIAGSLLVHWITKK